MSELTLRGVKGTPLTNQEIDDNFSNLNSDKVEIGGDLSGNTASPIVSGIRGFEVSNTTPTENQLLAFSNNSFVFINTPSSGETDLGIAVSNGSFLEISSSTGNNVVIPLANTSVAGLVSNTNQTIAGTKTFNSTITGSIDGNAGTATTLQTARTINGVSFNGSENITITADPNTHTHEIADVTGLQTALDGKANTSVSVAASETSGTLTINGDTTDLFVAEGLTGAITLAQPSGTPANGRKLLIRIKDNGTARGITWTTSAGAFRAVGITLPTTTVIDKVTYVGCVYNTTDSFWDVVATVTQA
jgi:hypothetical protein